MSYRLKVRLTPESAIVALDDVDVSIYAEFGNLGKILYEDPTNHCFYNWMVNGEFVNGVWFGNCNSNILDKIDSLKLKYVTKYPDGFILWFSSVYEGDIEPAVEWDAYFMTSNDELSMIDMSIGGIPPSMYFHFDRPMEPK